MNNLLKTTTYLLLLIIGTSCSVFDKTTVYNHKDKYTPPNAYQIDSNFYCDETEISNFHWDEYQNWNKKVFGEISKQYAATIIDTTVWIKINPVYKIYSYHPAYRNYPLVGITHTQALAYSQWRSDRVFQHILIKYGVLKPDTGANSTNYFTVEKYFSGNYKGIKPDYKIPYPEFRLPSKTERKQIVALIDSTRTQNELHKHDSPKYSMQYGTVVCLNNNKSDSLKKRMGSTAPIYTTFSRKNIDPVYSLRGNACEWSDTPGICYGGSWNMPFESITKQDEIVVTDNANAATGFRNVVEWKYWKP